MPGNFTLVWLVLVLSTPIGGYPDHTYAAEPDLPYVDSVPTPSSSHGSYDSPDAGTHQNVTAPHHMILFPKNVHGRITLE